MKIDSAGAARGVGAARKAEKGKPKGEGFARALGGDEDEEAAGSVQGSPVLGPIGALLSLQEHGEDHGQSAQAKARGEELLEKLDALRHAMLTGKLVPDELDGLVTLVRSERAVTADPRLAETLDEIELRARVELAKLGRDV